MIPEFLEFHKKITEPVMNEFASISTRHMEVFWILLSVLSLMAVCFLANNIKISVSQIRHASRGHHMLDIKVLYPDVGIFNEIRTEAGSVRKVMAFSTVFLPETVAATFILTIIGFLSYIMYKLKLDIIIFGSRFFHHHSDTSFEDNRRDAI